MQSATDASGPAWPCLTAPPGSRLSTGTDSLPTSEARIVGARLPADDAESRRDDDCVSHVIGVGLALFFLGVGVSHFRHPERPWFRGVHWQPGAFISRLTAGFWIVMSI